MKKKIISLCLVVCLLAVAIVGGTLAYFTDTSSADNTMVFGKVDIAQNEYEWNAEKTELQAFTQNKPLMPYVGNLGWEIPDGEFKGHPGVAYRRFTMENVVDKYITVKNNADAYADGKDDGSRDAYVRTIVAIPVNSTFLYENSQWRSLIGVSVNGNNGGYTNSKWTYVTGDYKIDGVDYTVYVFTYADPLKPQYETEPSFCQIYMQNTVTQQDIEKTNCSTVEIRALSQATQALGFSDATTALNTSFGEITDANLSAWFK